MSQGRLDFNVIYASSEDASHPVANLHSSLRGWLSGKFPETPQEIILQPKTQQIETLHEIQFLTSNTIPAPLRIDVFVFTPDNEQASQEALQLSQVVFEKVGSIQFSQSNNSERNGVQIKSAYLTHEFFLLKLVMYGHQQLRDNVFNQIGLQGLYLIGQSSQLQALNLQDELKYSDFILQKLNAFMTVRQHAIEIEDFHKAGAVNDQMKQIRQIGDAAMGIIKLREEAARNGNYLQMKGLDKSLSQIQAKLDCIKEAETQKPSKVSDRIYYYQQTCSEHEMMPLSDDLILRPPVSLADPSRLINERQEKLLLERAHQVQAQLPYMDPVAVNNFERQQMQISDNKQRILRQGSALSVAGEAIIQSNPFVRQLSGQILPNPIVRQQSGRIRPAGADIYNQKDSPKSQNQSDFQMAQPVQHSAEVDQDYIQNVSDFFQGSELPRQLFNPEWKLREQAIRAMEKVFIQDQNDDALLFEALIRTTAVATKDKIAFVVHSALEVCANVLQLRLANFQKQIAQDQVDLVIENIIAKAADLKLKNTIFKLTTRIVKHPSIGATKLIEKTTEPSKKGVEAKLQLLAEILASFGEFQLQQYQRIVTFAISQLSSSVNKVKELGYTVLVHLYAISPQETRVIIETSAIVRTPQKHILLHAFQLVDQQKILEALDSVQTMKHAIQNP